jgi:hypothetical protein
MTKKRNYDWTTEQNPLKKDRPICPQCKKPLIPWIDREEPEWPRKKSTRRESIVKWKYRGYGHFCTMTCATRFANIVVDSKIGP